MNRRDIIFLGSLFLIGLIIGMLYIDLFQKNIEGITDSSNNTTDSSNNTIDSSNNTIDSSNNTPPINISDLTNMYGKG